MIFIRIIFIAHLLIYNRYNQSGKRYCLAGIIAEEFSLLRDLQWDKKHNHTSANSRFSPISWWNQTGDGEDCHQYPLGMLGWTWNVSSTSPQLPSLQELGSPERKYWLPCFKFNSKNLTSETFIRSFKTWPSLLIRKFDTSNISLSSTGTEFFISSRNC